MVKSPDAFRSIGEVSRLVGVAPHVLRYWEGQFTQLSPVKRADGRRYYRPDDVRLVAGLCQVLREEGLSIRGAKILIEADRGAGLRDIGAARLGDFADGSPAPSAGPAVRLVRPSRPTPSARSAPAAKPADRPVLPETTSSPPIQDKPLPVALSPLQQREYAASADQPRPAPSVAWLIRLLAASDRLRQLQNLGHLTPQIAASLRESR